MSDELKKTVAMPWTPEEFLQRRRDESGSESDPTPIAEGHAWVRGYLVNVDQLTAERDALTAERDKDYQEVRRLQGIVRKQMDQEAEYQERLRLERADKVQYKQDALVLLEKLTELREAAERCITNDLCNCSNAHANLRAVLAKVKP